MNRPRSATDKFGATLYDKTEEDDRVIAERLAMIAENRGVSRAQIALAWMLRKPAVTAPIIGASRAEQLADLINAVDVELTQEKMTDLESAYQPHPVVGFE